MGLLLTSKKVAYEFFDLCISIMTICRPHVHTIVSRHVHRYFNLCWSRRTYQTKHTRNLAILSCVCVVMQPILEIHNASYKFFEIFLTHNVDWLDIIPVHWGHDNVINDVIVLLFRQKWPCKLVYTITLTFYLIFTELWRIIDIFAFMNPYAWRHHVGHESMIYSHWNW